MKQSQSPTKLTRKDKLGRSIRAGDWVRLVKIPPDVNKYMPRVTQLIFKQSLGKTFKIEAFNKYNLAELDLTKRLPNTIGFGLSRNIFCCSGGSGENPNNGPEYLSSVPIRFIR